MTLNADTSEYFINFKYYKNNNFARGYIAGLYDAEGAKNIDQLIIYNTDITIINRVINYLKILGHQYRIRTRISKNKKYKTKYELIILLKNRPNLLNFVIEFQPYQRYNFIQYHYQIRHSKSLKVKSIELYKKITVYNFETSTQNYIANGIIVHNCKTEPLVTDMTVMEAQEKFNGWIQSGNYKLFTDKFEKIVDKDIRMVHRSDFLIVHLFPNIKTTGTIHEMAEAWRQNKPIYLIWKEAKSNLSKWALYLVISSGGRLFESENKLIDFLAVKYAIKNQSFRKQITQILKSIIRLIDEKIYTFRIKKGKQILAELLKKKEQQKKAEAQDKKSPKKPEGSMIKEDENKETKE